MITAQWSTNRFGMKYRYYRCTKKKGKCGQGYLREDVLVSQLKERLEQISLPDDWTDYMLEKVEVWRQESVQSSGSAVGRLKESERETQEKLDKLVSLYLDGDIPKENYLLKKSDLLKQKVSFASKLESARQERKNWVEPLREWILDMKKATQLVSSDDFSEIKDFLYRVGTNPKLRDKSVSVSFCPPTEFARKQKTDSILSPFSAPLARADFAMTSSEVRICDPTGSRTLV